MAKLSLTFWKEDLWQIGWSSLDSDGLAQWLEEWWLNYLRFGGSLGKGQLTRWPEVWWLFNWIIGLWCGVIDWSLMTHWLKLCSFGMVWWFMGLRCDCFLSWGVVAHWVEVRWLIEWGWWLFHWSVGGLSKGLVGLKNGDSFSGSLAAHLVINRIPEGCRHMWLWQSIAKKCKWKYSLELFLFQEKHLSYHLFFQVFPLKNRISIRIH